MEPRFDPTGRAGPRDWADLYQRFQAFLLQRARAKRAAESSSAVPPPPPPPPQGRPEPHRCSARTCTIFTCGDFHVCAATCDVHYCADVYTCDRRVSVREQGIIVCAVSGCAKRSNRYDHFGYLLAYTEGGAVAAPSGSSKRGRGRGRGDDEDGAGGRHLAAYKRARVCGRLRGVTQIMPRATRDAILSGRGGRAGGDVGDADDAAAAGDTWDGASDDGGDRDFDDGDAAAAAADDDDGGGQLPMDDDCDDAADDADGGGAVVAEASASGTRASENRARAASARAAAERRQRDTQADLEREADVAWLCREFVRKDDGQTVARRQASREIRWRKVVNGYVADCVRAKQPVYLMLLISFMTKQAADLDRWRVAYGLVPDACLPTLRAWAADRVNALWTLFRSQKRDKNASPLKYSYAYHTLAVLYCSATGITWANSTAWLLSPIPYLAVLLPSQKDLGNYTVGRHAHASRIEKGVFTRTSKMTRNWLVKLTPRGQCATAAVDAPHEAAMRAWPPCTYRAPTAAPTSAHGGGGGGGGGDDDG